MNHEKKENNQMRKPTNAMHKPATTPKRARDTFTQAAQTDNRVHLTVRISPELRHRLSIYAAENQRTVTDIVTQAVTDLLDS